MTITKNYAMKLISAGRATIDGYTTDSVGNVYWIVNRHDIHRTDHFVDNGTAK